MFHSKKLQEWLIKFKIFNKAFKPHDRNRWLIPRKSTVCSFIYDNCNYFSQKKRKKQKKQKQKQNKTKQTKPKQKQKQRNQ